MYGGTHEFMKHEDDVETTAGPPTRCPLIFHNPLLLSLLEIETIEKNIHTFGGGWTRDGERDRCLAWTIWNSNSRIFKKFKGLVKQRDPISGRLLRVTAGHLVYTNQISNKFFRTRLFLPSREGNFLFEREDGNERSGCGCRKGLWERQWMLFETRIETRRVKLDGDSKDWLHFKRFLRFLTPIKRSWKLIISTCAIYYLVFTRIHWITFIKLRIAIRLRVLREIFVID